MLECRSSVDRWRSPCRMSVAWSYQNMGQPVPSQHFFSLIGDRSIVEIAELPSRGRLLPRARSASLATPRLPNVLFDEGKMLHHRLACRIRIFIANRVVNVLMHFEIARRKTLRDQVTT